MGSRPLKGRRPAFEALEARGVPSGFGAAGVVSRVMPPPPPLVTVEPTALGVVDSAYLGADVADPSLIKAGETYYLFTTGPGITVRSSTDLVDWRPAGQVFAGGPPDWAERKVPGATEVWAPDISYFGGAYHLYYAVSRFGGQQSVIGLATNATLDPSSPDYRWVDRGEVLESAPGRSNFNAIDPNIVLDGAGTPWLAYGSQWSGIKLARIDPASGMLAGPAAHPGGAARTRIFSLATRPNSSTIEAPFLVHRGGYYYLFVSFGISWIGENSTYRVMVGRSRTLTGPYLDRSGRPMLEGGGTPVLVGSGRYRGPGSNAVLLDGSQSWIVNHAYDAEQGGSPKLQVRPLAWDAHGWPVAGSPIET